jgi:hypothetical protein
MAVSIYESRFKSWKLAGNYEIEISTHGTNTMLLGFKLWHVLANTFYLYRASRYKLASGRLVQRYGIQVHSLQGHCLPDSIARKLAARSHDTFR